MPTLLYDKGSSGSMAYLALAKEILGDKFIIPKNKGVFKKLLNKFLKAPALTE